MFYERKIKYFDYIEAGEKIKNVGFIKIEVRDAECNIDIQIKGVPIKESIKREIILNGYDKTSSLGEITMQNGDGELKLHKCNSMALGNQRLAYSELENIQITVDEMRMIRCFWAPKDTVQCKEEKTQVESKPPAEEKARVENELQVERKTKEEGKVGVENILQVKSKIQVGRNPKAGNKPQVEDNAQAEKRTWVQEYNTVERELEKKGKTEANQKEEKAENVNFREDKWSQIASIYPRICPFEDEREYLLIQPRDFVMLSGRSYPLVNNSFLLHGYYNYNHLILARKQGRGEDSYYIGVPGNFYDREKQVAIMFGFESFECKEEPAGLGDYGYYMIRVDL